MLGRAIVQAFSTPSGRRPPAATADEVTAWDKNELDITDEDAVAQHIRLLEPALVINAAAYTNVDQAEEHAEEADMVNGYAVGNLAVTCAEAGIPLLHVSTDYVFNGTKEEGYAEIDEPRNPVNAYGRSKLLGETLLKENGGAFWLVRTAWLYGTSGQPFVDKILHAASVAGRVRVVSDQHGSPTFTGDLASAIRKLVHDRVPFGVYHLVNGETATWADLAEATLALAGIQGAVERVPSSAYPQKAARPRWSILRNTKRPALRPWRQALEAYLRLRLPGPARLALQDTSGRKPGPRESRTSGTSGWEPGPQSSPAIQGDLVGGSDPAEVASWRAPEHKER